MKTDLRHLLILLGLVLVSVTEAPALPSQNSQDKALEAARTKLSGTTPAQWRVVWTENPQTQATIAWSTAEAGSKHGIRIGTKPGVGKSRRSSSVKTVPAVKNGKYDGSPDLYYHHVELKGLKPDTIYFFVMVSDRNASRELHFRTAPAKAKSFRLIHGGDSRSNPDRRRKINRLISTLAAKDATILAFAHGGDFILDGRKLDQWSTWMSDHELTVTPRGRILPLIPARGNHERSGELYNEVLNSPGGGTGKNYFATLLSPQVLLVTLNTEASTSGDQSKFLEETLKRNARVQWQLAQYHRPVYPAVKGPSGAKKDWVPLFEKYNLDLVCESDGHCIKRTVPIRNDKADPTGVVYVGEGGLGVGQRTPKPERWYLEPPGKTGSGDHVFLLSFTPRSLHLRVILLTGKLFDEYAMKPRRR